MAAPSGQFGVAPIGRVLFGRDISAGGRVAHGELKVHNQTPTPLTMRLVVKLADEDLDDCIAIEIRGDGRRLVRSTLGEVLRHARSSSSMRAGASGCGSRSGCRRTRRAASRAQRDPHPAGLSMEQPS